MYKILTLNKISQSGLASLDKAKYEVSDSVKDPDAVIVRSFAMHDWDLPESLQAVARAGAGTNNIPIDKCSDKGIIVFNTPGANANAVKELVIAGLLMSSRKIVQGINWARTLDGQADVAKTVEKGKADYAGPEISGKTIGVVGAAGAIGLLVANACAALGMKVIGLVRHPNDKIKAALNPEVKIVGDIEEIYAESDYISLHIPFNDSTKQMINGETLGKCKKGVRILNFARGELVCNDSIKKALESGQVSCYVTDFPNESVVGHEGVIPVPHLGASTPESEENCAVMASAQIKNYLETGNIVNSVNFPNIEYEMAGNRICAAYKGNDELVNGIKGILSGASLAYSLYEAKKGSLGYVIVEYSAGDAAGLAEKIIDEIKKLDGVLSVKNFKK